MNITPTGPGTPRALRPPPTGPIDDRRKASPISFAEQKDRDKGGPDPVETAREFESLLVQQLVSGMRKTADVFGEGGMFGDGPGADTYAGWFDAQLAQKVTATADIGVVDLVLADMARWDRSAELRNTDQDTPQDTPEAR